MTFRTGSKLELILLRLLGTPFTAGVVVRTALAIEAASTKHYPGLLPVIPELECSGSEKFYVRGISLTKARDILDEVLFAH